MRIEIIFSIKCIMPITRRKIGGRRRRHRGRSSTHRRRRRGRGVRTRASLKRALASYRRRRKLSHCRGKGPAACRGTAGCKVASGRKRSFCRKTRSTRRRR